MLVYPEFNEQGEKVLTRENGFYKNMLMDLSVFMLKKDKPLVYKNSVKEAAFLLVEGEVEFIWAGKSVKAIRKNKFADKPYCLHVPANTEVTIKTTTTAEVLMQATTNNQKFDPVFYKPEDCRIGVAGDGMWENTAVRDICTIIDYSNAPYSKLVIGEVIHRPGRWSSYIPHHHAQPEVYYYHFDKPQGFGACFIGENVYYIKDGSFSAIPGGLAHPQVVAPGYKMYFAWMIRHIDNNPWTTRIDVEEHKWLLQ